VVGLRIGIQVQTGWPKHLHSLFAGNDRQAGFEFFEDYNASRSCSEVLLEFEKLASRSYSEVLPGFEKCLSSEKARNPWDHRPRWAKCLAEFCTIKIGFRGALLADWYYIGHYGQLGPLTREQIDDLVDGGVIEGETYVWCTGMGDWRPAIQVTELRAVIQPTIIQRPPPPPSPSLQPSPPPMGRPYSPPSLGHQSTLPSMGTDLFPNQYANYQPTYATIPSDRNRIVAGLLQLLIPGVGRIYLGYAAHGVLQLILTPCLGLGWFWSVIDGILILAGGLKLDGYGRRLQD